MQGDFWPDDDNELDDESASDEGGSDWKDINAVLTPEESEPLSYKNYAIIALILIVVVFVLFFPIALYMEIPKSRALEMMKLLKEMDRLPNETSPLQKELKKFIKMGEAGDDLLGPNYAMLKTVLNEYEAMTRPSVHDLIAKQL